MTTDFAPDLFDPLRLAIECVSCCVIKTSREALQKMKLQIFTYQVQSNKSIDNPWNVSDKIDRKKLRNSKK